MMNQQNKEFDCIAMKREIQNQIYEETKDMSSLERLEYFRNAVRSSKFRDWWEHAGKDSKKAD
ncbi:MAG: hypothetical protein HY960_11210 [Ignavibacteriae bacterium]|nr:hypothetical protein [Ignavibacteriota bacterium]